VISFYSSSFVVNTPINLSSSLSSDTFGWLMTPAARSVGNNRINIFHADMNLMDLSVSDSKKLQPTYTVGSIKIINHESTKDEKHEKGRFSFLSNFHSFVVS